MTKLDRPPQLVNWVRYNYPDVAKTTSSLVAFDKNSPKQTYAHGLRLVADRIQHRTDWETLRKSCERDGRSNSRALCLGLLKAFQEHEHKLDLFGLKAYDLEVLPWRVSKDIFIPVKPLVTINFKGRLEPVFLFSWRNLALTDYQLRLLMTVIEDAVFSLSDYAESNGRFIAFPFDKETKKRTLKTWERGSYDLLTPNEVSNQVEIYLSALDLAKKLRATEAKADVNVEAAVAEVDRNQGAFDF